MYKRQEIDFVTKPLNEMRLMECTECEMSAPGAYDIDIEADDINAVSYTHLHGMQIKKEDYELVYVGELFGNMSLDDIFERFNICLLYTSRCV